MPVTLILKEDIETLGKAGELVNVKPGYARNYLIPKQLAVVATHQNLLWLKDYRHELEKEAQIKREQAELEKEKIAALGDIEIGAPVGPTGKLFGRVTAHEVVARINQLGQDKIQLAKHTARIVGHPRGVDELGNYQVVIQIAASINLTVNLIVSKAD
ncbi:MAG: 50S ribosomal protein L9 [Candidatus Caenarcaniphilales bacterium]|nr:50S ribosomal protein L9 [Candidatus Caenarcaniphilales bacterium]